MSGYVPCGFTPGQTVRYRQGFDRAERTIVDVIERAMYHGWDTWADGVTVTADGPILPAAWFEEVE